MGIWIRILKKLVLVLSMLGLFTFPIVVAQATWISGYVKDANGNPIAGAIIRAEGAFETSTVTDTSGYYRLGLSAGEWTITVSYDDYEESKTIVLADGEHKVVDFGAATVVVHVYAPNPVIVDYPAMLVVEEGKSVDFDVKVRNDGTEGAVSVAITCPVATITTTSTGFNMKQGETVTIHCSAYGLNVGKDTLEQIKIFAQGRGGTDTQYIDLTVKDVEGATPKTPPPPAPSFDYWWMVLIGIVIIVGIILALATRKKRVEPISEAKIEPPRKEAVPTVPTVVKKGVTCPTCGYNNPPYAANYCVNCGARLK